MRSVEERLEALERSNRRLKLLAGLLIAGTTTAVLMGAGEKAERPEKVTVKEINAESFNVVKDGKLLASLGAHKSIAGESGLLLMNDGSPVVELRGNRRGGAIFLRSPTDPLQTPVTIDGSPWMPGMKIIATKKDQEHSVMVGVTENEARATRAIINVRNGDRVDGLPEEGK